MIELQYLKKDIDDLIDMVGDLEEEEISLFRYLGKKAIFLKMLKYSMNITDEYSYISQLLSDIMYLIRSYKDNEIRYTYLNIRSIIEAFTRLFNEVPYSSSVISMSRLLEEINIYITKNNLVDSKDQIIDYQRLKSLYSESCGYVHGNKDADQSLSTYYQSLNYLRIDSRHKSRLNRSIRFLIETIILISSYRFSCLLNDYSVRKKEIFRYLVGDFNVSNIKFFSNLIIVYKHGTKEVHRDIMTCRRGTPIVIPIVPIKNFKLLSSGTTNLTAFDDSDIYVECKVIPPKKDR